MRNWHLTLLLAPAFDERAHRSHESTGSAFGDVSSEAGRLFGEHTVLLPGMAALYLVGKATHNRTVEDASSAAFKGWVLGSAITGMLKLSFGRKRPYEGLGPHAFRPFSGANAFPSGHTTAAFAVATALDYSVEFKGSSTLFYGLASLTAASRVYDGKHWVSDVVAGAVIGYLSGRWAATRD
jgi:membrane-associated phospholipid phosphatase